MGYLARATRLLESHRDRNGRPIDHDGTEGADERRNDFTNPRQTPLPSVEVGKSTPPLADAREVAWRVEVMRRRVPFAGPLPFLVAREVPRGTGLCRSCGELVAAMPGGLAIRCNACLLAARQVADECSARHDGDDAAQPAKHTGQSVDQPSSAHGEK